VATYLTPEDRQRQMTCIIRDRIFPQKIPLKFVIIH